jgi:hypothetical protein
MVTMQGAVRHLRRELEIKKFIRKMNGIFMVKTKNARYQNAVLDWCHRAKVHPKELEGIAAHGEIMQRWKEVMARGKRR